MFFMLKDFFTSLPRNFFQVFSPPNLKWHGLIIALTALIVFSSFDWRYFLSVRNEALNQFFFPALSIGFLLPILLPLILIILGFGFKKYKIYLFYAAAIFQAAAVGWFTSSFYKSLTGRVQPNVQNINESINQSLNWNFGFFEHGIFWGWPSSHTTVAFAMMATIIILLQRKYSFLKYVVVIYAFYIGFAVSLRIHWFSEFIAGIILGTLAGIVVGKYWQNKKEFYEQKLEVNIDKKIA